MIKHPFFAQQGIYDSKLELYAHELLFRPGPNNYFPQHQKSISANLASEIILENLVHNQAIHQVKHPIFINFTHSLIMCDALKSVTTEKLVIEILEDIPVDNMLLSAVSELKKFTFSNGESK